MAGIDLLNLVPGEVGDEGSLVLLSCFWAIEPGLYRVVPALSEDGCMIMWGIWGIIRS